MDGFDEGETGNLSQRVRVGLDADSVEPAGLRDDGRAGVAKLCEERFGDGEIQLVNAGAVLLTADTRAVGDFGLKTGERSG